MTYNKSKTTKSSLSKEWQNAMLFKNATIRDAVKNLDENGFQIVMIINQKNKLIGTLSDGDIRRGLLKGLTLEDKVESVMYEQPLVVPKGLSKQNILKFMTANKIHQIPIVNKSNEIIGLHLWNNLREIDKLRENLFVIMAGGKGVRMQPHTKDRPKAMLKIGKKPMLEHIILQAKAEGFINFVISTYYLSEIIENYFGDGSKWNINITYLHEKSPLGTAGALSLLKEIPKKPFVVSNCDVITDLKYGVILDFHNKHEADATMAIRMHEIEHPFGVVKTEGLKILEIQEKPVFQTYVNAGVYVLSPQTLNLLSKNVLCDMPTLFHKAKQKKMETLAYPIHEEWQDVGRPGELLKVNLKYK